MHNVKYGTTSISFEIIRNKRLKNTYIQVDTNGVLVKTNQSNSIKNIHKMVEEKSAWILKKLEHFKSIPINKKIDTGSRLYYMGKSYYVNMTKEKEAKKILIKFTYSKFQIITPIEYKTVELHNAIENFYKEKAKEKILPLSEKWSKIMQVEPTHISFRYAKKRWGSCSSTHRISFNYQLIKLSNSLIEYVIIHELAHIINPNHSQAFWKEVYKYLPDYKTREEKIRMFEKII